MTIQELINELQHSINELGFSKDTHVVFDVQNSEGVIDQTDNIDLDNSSCKEILPINIRLQWIVTGKQHEYLY